MELVDKIIKGERAAIAKAITLVESSKDTDQQISIESFGSYLVSKNYKLGILAIDPSSQITGGSILGDKTRMVEISKNPNTFIRSTPS